jgi:3-polyprenyl-4-hydroxybenzoate decarboxylase
MGTLLSKVNVPICLVPATWQPGPLKSVAYLTDLRYCRTDIMGHLLKFIAPNTAVYIAHMAMNGVVDLASEYANGLFTRVAGMFLKEAKLYLHHIKESQSLKVADVLVNSMKNGALVVTNHSAHFHALLGNNLRVRDPELIRVPLLIYPA